LHIGSSEGNNLDRFPYTREMRLLIFIVFCLLISLKSIHAESTELDPDRAQAVLDAQEEESVLNEELREASVELMEKDLQISLHYLSYQAAVHFGTAYLKERTSLAAVSRQWSGGDSQDLIKKAVLAFASVDESKRSEIAQVLSKQGFEGQMDAYFYAWLEKEEQTFGGNYWEELVEDGSSAKRASMVHEDINEENYSSIGFIVGAVSAGLFENSRGAVLRLQNLVALDASLGEKPLFHAKDSPEFEAVFGTRYETDFKQQMLSDEDFFPFFRYGLSLARSEERPWAADSLEQKAMIRESSTFLEQHDLNHQGQGLSSGRGAHHGDASRIGNQKYSTLRRFFSMRNMAKTIKDSLKVLPNKGATGISKFLGAGFAKSPRQFVSKFAKGLKYGLIAEAMIQGAVVVAFGQRQESMHIGEDTVEVESQRTNSQDGDSWLKDRKFAFLDLKDEYADNAVAKIAGTAAAVGLSAIAGVSLPVTVIAAGVGFAVYHGVKGIMNTETVQNWVNRNLIRRLEGQMEQMPYVVDQMQWDEDKREEQAETIARLSVKRKEASGQSPQRMFFLDRIASVQIYKSGKYFQNSNEENVRGETFDHEAHMRYDYIDVQGQIAVWDSYTPEKMHMVGEGEELSGLDVCFVNADSEMDYEEGRFLKNREGSNFRILSNGSLWARRDDDEDKWVVKGLTNKTDVVLRSGKGRYSYDPDSGEMRFVSQTKLVTPNSEEEQSRDSSNDSQDADSADSRRDGPEFNPVEAAAEEHNVLDDAFSLAP